MMAKGVCKCLCLFFLSILVVCSSEFSPIKVFRQKELRREDEQTFYSPRRELPNFHFKATRHDSMDPPTKTFSTTPITNPLTAASVVVPPGNPTATVVNIPSTTPKPEPYTNPLNSPLQITNPVTTPSTVPGAQPVTNPAATNPAPAGGVPATTPATNPVTPPAATSSPAVPGQSWCVAKTGAQDTALQQALDYACGIGGADCSAIQQGGSCYNPSTLQNHASYAFNSYYQKNPVQSSCDFGGTAIITTTNPSTAPCIYPPSSPSTSATPRIASPPPAPTSPTPPITSPTPAITSPSPPITSPTPPITFPTPTMTSPPVPPAPVTSSPGAAVPGSGSPPTLSNVSNPASGTPIVFGDSPPSFDNSTSMSTSLQPFISCIILVTSIAKIELILDI